MGNERRRHVRVRPAYDLPLRAELSAGAAPGPLQVVDLSFGGMAFQTAGGLRDCAIGDVLTFMVAFGTQAPVEMKGVVRHASGERAGLTGIEFEDITDDARRAMRRYVSELFERGQSV